MHRMNTLCIAAGTGSSGNSASASGYFIQGINTLPLPFADYLSKHVWAKIGAIINSEAKSRIEVTSAIPTLSRNTAMSPPAKPFSAWTSGNTSIPWGIQYAGAGILWGQAVSFARCSCNQGCSFPVNRTRSGNSIIRYWGCGITLHCTVDSRAAPREAVRAGQRHGKATDGNAWIKR